MKKIAIMFLAFLFTCSLASAISVEDFSLADLGFRGFVVEANLDSAGSAQVLYGKTGALGSASNLASSSSEHLLQVDGLESNTVYFYRVVGKDSQGNSYSSAISLTRTPAQINSNFGVSDLYLIDSSSGNRLRKLANNDVIDLSQYDSRVTLEADTFGSVESVLFFFDDKYQLTDNAEKYMVWPDFSDWANGYDTNFMAKAYNQNSAENTPGVATLGSGEEGKSTNLRLRFIGTPKNVIEQTPTTTTNPSTHNQPTNTNAKLIFKSGFEGQRLVRDIDQKHYTGIVGYDTQTGYSWREIDLLGANLVGIHRVMNYGNYDDYAHNEIVTTIGRDGKPTSALYQEITDWPHPRSVTQSTMQINGITQNPRQLYVRFWMKIPQNEMERNYDWRALIEYKTSGYDEWPPGEGADGFRLLMGLGRAGYSQGRVGELYSNIQGDVGRINPEPGMNWGSKNYDVYPPDNEWFLNEYYIDWGDGVTNGHTWWKIDGQLVGEHRGRLTRNNQIMKYLFLWQMYGGNWDSNGGNTVTHTQWVDDVEIWEGIPY